MQTPFIERWVSPFYLRILHGNYATEIVVGEERERFNSEVVRALEEITPSIASQLVAGFWREAITGSWFAGLKRFEECQSEIGELLLASKTCYAGQSHTFAMACFADDLSVEYLKQYLDTYLSRRECCYDQGWAMPALMWIDQQRSTTFSEEYLAPGGLWEYFTVDKSFDSSAWTIDSCRSAFWRTMEYCGHHFMS